MRLGVLASGSLGLQVLSALIDEYSVSFVMTDRKSIGITEFCSRNGIDHYIGNPREENAKKCIRDKEVDVLVSANYLFIIDKDLISLPSIAAFNVHGSLLPKYRGRTPHVWAIINNETETGITAHLIDEGCDTGDIIEQICIPINSNDTGESILRKFESLYPSIINDVLCNIQNGTLKTVRQDHSKATFFHKRRPCDGLINWEWQKERIYNWVRAQSLPYPGAYTFLDGEKIIIDRVTYSDYGFDSKQSNGQIIELLEGKPMVKVSNGVLILESIRNQGIEINEKQFFTSANC